MQRCDECSTESDRIRVVRGTAFCEACYIENIPCAQFSDPLGIISDSSSTVGGGSLPSGSAIFTLLNRAASATTASHSNSFSDLESSSSDEGGESSASDDEMLNSLSEEELEEGVSDEEDDDDYVSALGLAPIGNMQTRVSCSLCKQFPCSAVILCCTECRESRFCITCAPTAMKSDELLFCSTCNRDVPRRRIHFLADVQLAFEKATKVTCVFCEETITMDRYQAHIETCEEVDEAPTSTKSRFDAVQRKILNTKRLLEKYQQDAERDARWKRTLNVPLDSIDSREEAARAQAYQESCQYETQLHRDILITVPPALFDQRHSSDNSTRVLSKSAAAIMKATTKRRKSRTAKRLLTRSSSSQHLYGKRSPRNDGISSIVKDYNAADRVRQNILWSLSEDTSLEH